MSAFLLPVFLAAGLIGGFVSSSPIGPINLWIINGTLRGLEERLRWFVVGVIAADLAYAVIAALGYVAFLQEGRLMGPVQIGAGVILIIIGLVSLRTKPETATQTTILRGTPVQDFALGAFMCGSNPAFLAFWIFTLNILDEWMGARVSAPSLILFLLGISLGDLIWFSLLSQLVRKGQTSLGPRILLVFRRVVPILLVILGMTAIFNAVRDWYAA